MLKRWKWRRWDSLGRLTKKQKALALELFGTDRLTRRQFARMMDERKEAAQEAYYRANDIDLLSLVRTPITDRGETRTGPCPMPGCAASKDGFWVNTSTNTGGCHTCFWPVKNGSGSGPVGFIRALTGCEGWEARDHLVGKMAMSVPQTARDSVKKEEPTQDFADEIRAARAALRGSDGLSRWARDYLMRERTLTEATWEHFGIGAVTDFPNKPFIASPFHHFTDGKLCGIRYSNAKICKTGSQLKRAAFGLPQIEGHEIAFVTEGEINAMSIWQIIRMMGHWADVVSVGSQGLFKKLAPDIAAKLDKARHIYLWADERKIGEEAKKDFRKAGVGVTVLYSHHKLDANDLLKRGHLGQLLSSILPPVVLAGEAPSWHESQEDLFDLMDKAGWLVHGLTGQEYAKGDELYKAIELAVMDEDAERVRAILGEIKALATGQAWHSLASTAELEKKNALFL